jgi:hypothetical protein
MGQTPTPALRQRAQPRHARDRQREWSELQLALREVNVRQNAMPILDDQAVARLIEGIFERGCEMVVRWSLKYGLQKLVNYSVIAGCRFNHRVWQRRGFRRRHHFDGFVERGK